MKGRLTKQFCKWFARLPREIQDQARASYRLFKENPYYPSLHFKCIDPQESLWSVRIGRRYRAVGVWEDDTILWHFIGTHEDYNHLL